jgi:hypothetical protein
MYAQSPLIPGDVESLVEKNDGNIFWKAFCIHENTMPGVEMYGSVIGMPDLSLGVDSSIALHISPIEIFGFRVVRDQGLVLFLR